MANRRVSADEDVAKPASYAGRWVARVRGKIVAQGGTPEQARRAAMKTRHKEQPEINFMPAAYSVPPLVAKVKNILPDMQDLYLVGGAVRDILLNRPSLDFDFAVSNGGISSARRVANALRADFVVLDEERDTGRAIVTSADGARTYLDFAALRGANIEADLRARDFTINSLGYDLLKEAVLDPMGGAEDIRARRVRACTPRALMDDPVRVLRAVRLAAALEFQILTETRELIRQAAVELQHVSVERQRDELFKILEGPKPDASMRALEMLGVLRHVLPELVGLQGVEQPAPHVHDVWSHTLSVLQNLESILAALHDDYAADRTNDLFTGLLTLRLGRYRPQFAQHFSEALNEDRSVRGLLFFAALYHDVAKPSKRAADEAGRIRFLGHDEEGARIAVERAQALHLSNDEVERLRTIIANHMRFHFHASRMEGEKKEPSRKAIYGFFRDTGRAGVDLVLLGLADLRGTRAHTLTQQTWSANLDVARILLENYWERPQETVAPPRLVDGNDLIRELQLEAGPQIGELIEAIREAQAVGSVADRAQALAYARTWLKAKPWP